MFDVNKNDFIIFGIDGDKTAWARLLPKMMMMMPPPRLPSPKKHYNQDDTRDRISRIACQYEFRRNAAVDFTAADVSFVVFL